MSQQRQQGMTTRSQPVQGLTRQVAGKLTRLDGSETTVLSTYSVEQAALWLDEAAGRGHIVSPSMSVQVFPHGRGLSVSVVQVTDFNPQGTQLYPIPGSANLGLHKNVLDDIGRGYGIDWPREWSQDVPFTRQGALQPDPRDEDPWVVQWMVCGRVRKLDGGWTTLPAMTKEIDLREGSSEVEQIRNRQADKEPNNPGLAKKKADAEIAQLRKFIKSHAQTKARLMVIGTLVRRSYSKEELQKPFYVFQSIWVGRSDNPEIDKMFAQGAMEMEMSARGMLYGGAVEPPPQLAPVSDQPYQEDAEMVEYNKMVAGSGMETVEQAGPKQCTPDECFGMGSIHVKACYSAGKPADEVKAEQASVFMVPKYIGGYRDRPPTPITDPSVDISSVLDFYIALLEQPDIPELLAQQYMAEQKLVEAEIERRRKL